METISTELGSTPKTCAMAFRIELRYSGVSISTAKTPANIKPCVNRCGEGPLLTREGESVFVILEELGVITAAGFELLTSVHASESESE